VAELLIIQKIFASRCQRGEEFFQGKWTSCTEYAQYISNIKSNQIHLRHKKAECNITIQDTKAVQICTNRCPKNRNETTD